MLDLNLVMPIYNEDEIIEVVVVDWITHLDKLNINYKIKLYNDGSKDNTLDVITSLQKKYQDRIVVIDKKNSGHGPTILQAYKDSLNANWIFQVDSDNEMKAKYFEQFWNKKEDFDFLIGKRVNRISPLFRKIMTYISYVVVRLFFGKGIKDVNSPYRLIKTEVFNTVFKSIPDDTFAPNIIVAGMACKNNIKVKSIDIEFTERTTGVPTLNTSILKLFKISFKSFYQIISYAKKH